MKSLLKKDFLEIYKNKYIIMALIIIQFMIISALYLLYNNNDITLSMRNHVTIGIIDEDDTRLSRMLVDYFKKNEVVAEYVTFETGTRSEVSEKFINNKITAYVVIPKGFVRGLIHMENPPMDVKISSQDLLNAVIIQNILESYEDYICAIQVSVQTIWNEMERNGFSDEERDTVNMNASTVLIMDALERNDLFRYTTKDYLPRTTIDSYYMISILIIFMMYSGLYVGFHILREKNNKTIDRLNSIGIATWKIIASKIIIYSSFFSFITNLWYVVYILIRKEKFQIYSVIFIFISIIFMISLSIMISAICLNEKTYILLGNMYCFLCLVIGGGIIPIAYLPNIIRKLGNGTPNAWIMKGLLFVKSGINIVDVLWISIIFIICTIIWIYFSNILYGSMLKIKTKLYK